MRIVAAGYYGFGNLGDELILTSLLSRLRERYPEGSVTVLSADPAATRRHHRVAAVSRWNLFSVLLAMWRSDLFVLGGGGLLQDGTSGRSIAYYLALVALARAFGLPVTLYAIGVERLTGRFWRRATAKVLSGESVRIVVRDQVSRDLLESFGLPSARIHVAADPVFGRNADRPPAPRYNVGRPTALVIPRLPCPPSGAALFTRVSRALRDEYGVDVRGMLFQPARERARLVRLSGRSFLPDVPFIAGESWEESASLVGRFDYVISARFHGLVLAALAQRPFIGVGDPDKIGRICETLGMPFLSWSAPAADVDRALRRLHDAPEPVAAPSLERLRSAASDILPAAAFPSEKEAFKTPALY